jgi:hypothetical protein
VVRSVRVCDISELSLVPSIPVQSSNHDFFCVGVTYSGEYDVCDVTLSVCISTPGKLEKYAWPRWEWNLRPLEYQPNQVLAFTHTKLKEILFEI